MDSKILAENRRARFDYEILESYIAGIELAGHEVKSVKAGHVSLVGSYAVVRGGEAWLLNAIISPYQQKNVPDDYDPTRTRRLLLTKPEIKELEGKLATKGINVVALQFFLKKGLIKIELGLGRGRKKHDKREVLKKRDIQREIEREM